MKPAFWWNPLWPSITIQLTEPLAGGGWEPAYTADQLREAKVEVLREAAEACPGYAKASNLREYIRRMADELERSKT